VEFLTNGQARAWAAEHGFEVNESFGRPVASELTAPLRFTIPADAGARVALARALWEAAFAGAPETLLWVTDAGVWPSGEHPPLAEAARRGLGATRALGETPGHLVRRGEDDAAVSVLCLAVLFLWDCWVLPAAGGPALFLSHDELGVAETRGTGERLAPLLEAHGVLDSRPRGA
jgi:hypothetical protein